jgi:hypothetical protein
MIKDARVEDKGKDEIDSFLISYFFAQHTPSSLHTT